MSEVGDFLWANYYLIYRPPGAEPATKEKVEQAITNLKDKLVVIRNEGKIKGVAIYFTLSDETYDLLEELDLTTEDCVRELAREHGKNVHFILVAGGGRATLRLGLAEVKRRFDVKTFSWWNPEMTKLHKYKVKE